MRLVKLNADEAPDVCQRFAIRGIPALLLLQRGRLIAQSAGAMDTQRIVEWTRAAHLPLRRPHMTIDKAVLAFAGFMVLLSLVLAYYVEPLWMLLTSLRRREHAPIRLHRLLPGGDGVQALGLKPGTSFR